MFGYGIFRSVKLVEVIETKSMKQYKQQNTENIKYLLHYKRSNLPDSFIYHTLLAYNLI